MTDEGSPPTVPGFTTVMHWLAHRRIQQAVSASLDGELGPAAMAEVHAHLSGCWGCSTDVELDRLVKRSLRKLAPGPAPADVPSPGWPRGTGRRRHRGGRRHRRVHLTPPGVLSTGWGSTTPLGVLMGHVVYGLVLAFVYGWLA